MKTTSAVILMAGTSSRFLLEGPKTLYEINKKPLFLYSLDVFYHNDNINKIVLSCHKDYLNKVKDIIRQNYDDNKVIIVEGGSTRLKSLQNALSKIDSDLVLVHDAARPLIKDVDIENLINASDNFECGTLYHSIFDTVKKVKDTVETINRDHLKATSTPQFFSKKLYQEILTVEDSINITDEIMLFEKDYRVAFIKESSYNLKLTTIDDLEYINYMLTKNNLYKIGHSFDFHTFEEGRNLYLGGIKFETSFGLKGHSDADVVYHAVAEAIIGALAMGDIGTWFPDTDDKYLDMDSSYFVKEAVKKLYDESFVIENIDLIIYLEKPNLKDYKILMAKNIKEITGASYVNVKATTLEKKGLVGKGEGIASEAVILIKKIA